jgi:hypothetical protein
MPIPPYHYVKPHPNIRRYPNPPYNGSWVCKGCGGIDYCHCSGDQDPICDGCGWPASACQCDNEGAWLRE